MTTQHLDEADQLADRIAVVDQGTVIADGTAAQLKAKVGGERIVLVVAPASAVAQAVEVLARHADGRPSAVGRVVQAAVAGAARRLPAIIRDLDAAGVQLDDLSIRHPSLDDVFLTLTGHSSGDPAESEQA